MAGKQIGVLGGDACRVSDNLNENTFDGCSECEHSEMCHGGLKCLTYALYKELNHKDIGCKL